MIDKQLTKTLPIVLKIIDAVTTIAAWELAYFIRFYIMKNGHPGQFDSFLFHSFILAAFVILYSTSNSLYDSNRYSSWYKESLLIIKSQVQSIVSFIVLLYFIRPDRLSRITIVLYAVLGVVLALVIRGVIRSLQSRARKLGRNLRHALVLGQGNALEDIVAMFKRHPEKGIRIIGWIGEPQQAEKFNIPQISLNDVSLDGPDAPDVVIFGFNAENHVELDSALFKFNKTSIPTIVFPDIANAFIGYKTEEFHGIPAISINAARITAIQAFIKRMVDIIGSTMALLVLSPLLCLIAILVKWKSRGPVFFGQERMTQDGETFIMWKFRSMYIDAEEQGAKWAESGDDRCTPIGRFLRRTSLDELPQFWNVLKGDMSLVGPRPERPMFIKDFKHEIPSYMLRHKMKSGITGWAQVNGWRGQTSLVSRIEYDLYYIRNWSLVFDIRILFLTFLYGFIHENAY